MRIKRVNREHKDLYEVSTKGISKSIFRIGPRIINMDYLVLDPSQCITFVSFRLNTCIPFTLRNYSLFCRSTAELMYLHYPNNRNR